MKEWPVPAAGILVEGGRTAEHIAHDRHFLDIPFRDVGVALLGHGQPRTGKKAEHHGHS